MNACQQLFLNFLLGIVYKRKMPGCVLRKTHFNKITEVAYFLQNIVRVNDLSMKEYLRKLDSESEVRKMLDELMRLGWLKNYILDKTPEAINMISFLNEFWDWETSPYIKEKLRKAGGIFIPRICAENLKINYLKHKPVT